MFRPSLLELRGELLVGGQWWAHPADEAPDPLGKLPLPCFQNRVHGGMPAVDHGATRLEKLRLTGRCLKASVPSGSTTVSRVVATISSSALSPN